MGRDLRECKIDQDHQERVFQWTEFIEGQAERVLRDMPWTPENEKAWSPRIASLVIEACSLIDSVFKAILPAGASAIVKGKDTPIGVKPSLEKLAAYFNPKRGLHDYRALFLSGTGHLIGPFSIWDPENTTYENPDWWETYNDLKHNRVQHLHEVTLRVAVQALAGAFLVVATSVELGEGLIRSGWLDTSRYVEYVALDDFRRHGPLAAEPNVHFPLESELFFTSVGSRRLPARIEDFQPSTYGASSRVRRFFPDRRPY